MICTNTIITPNFLLSYVALQVGVTRDGEELWLAHYFLVSATLPRVSQWGRVVTSPTGFLARRYLLQRKSQNCFDIDVLRKSENKNTPAFAKSILSTSNKTN